MKRFGLVFCLLAATFGVMLSTPASSQAQSLQGFSRNPFIQRGLSFYNDQKYPLSIKLFLQAYNWNRSTKAERIMALQYLGFIYVILGNRAKAQKFFLDLLSISPKYRLTDATIPPKFVRFFNGVVKLYKERRNVKIVSLTPEEISSNKPVVIKLRVMDSLQRAKRLTLFYRLENNARYYRRNLEESKPSARPAPVAQPTPARSKPAPVKVAPTVRPAARLTPIRTTPPPAVRAVPRRAVPKPRGPSLRAPAIRKVTNQTTKATDAAKVTARKAATKATDAATKTKDAAKATARKAATKTKDAATKTKDAAKATARKAATKAKDAATNILKNVKKKVLKRVVKPVNRVKGSSPSSEKYFTYKVPKLMFGGLENNQAYYFEYYVVAYDSNKKPIAQLGSKNKPVRIKRTFAKKEPKARPKAKSAPFYKTWWFWTLTGVVVAGGVTAAVVPFVCCNRPEQPKTGEAIITVIK